ncbi:hypothetical protein [Cohnella rhizosphaerae]|uniref:Uncharacterized protein n=1 Tax=Cohnella rhizosphaerae TaxID=1457232 RepID=A0A9X4KWT7_9BACL|nr:hypothetical protein [Cohnella rhizosphaerae]MDG0811801.1 hypothetical protein [Cohnella rhizosphaerae]
MKTRQEPISGLEWIAWGMLGITLLISMFNNGIFQGYGVWATNQVQFEKPMLYELIVMSLFALWSSIVIIQKKT